MDRRHIRGGMRLSIELTAKGSVNTATGLWNRPPMIFKNGDQRGVLERFDRRLAPFLSAIISLCKIVKGVCIGSQRQG
jgi:hypothetical protein